MPKNTTRLRIYNIAATAPWHCNALVVSETNNTPGGMYILSYMRAATIFGDEPVKNGNFDYTITSENFSYILLISWGAYRTDIRTESLS